MLSLHQLLTRQLLTLLVLVLGLSFAQEEGLYGQVGLPENAAFMRVLHASPSSAMVEASLEKLGFLPLSFGDVSFYHAVSAGSQTITVGAFSETLTVTQDAFYTVVLYDGGLAVLEDEPLSDPTRALLTLYNLSTLASVDLFADGDTEVITGVASGASASIAVNPVDAAFAVYADGVRLSELTGLVLTRNNAYSVIVVGDADAPLVGVAEAEIFIQ